MSDRSVGTGADRQAALEARLPAELAVDGVRRNILEAALRLFATRGYHGSSIREIVKLAEIQASAVYAYFPSKEHVLAELARAGHEAHFTALQAALLEAGGDPVDQLGAVVRANAIFHVSYPYLGMVVNAEMYALSDELAAPALAIRRQSTALLFQILDRGARLGRFELPAGPAGHARDVTAGALGAMTMRIPYWYSPAGGLTRKELATMQVELALRMVGAKR